MGYLSNNELTVDAILTKAGRAKLAKGQDLGITKFALADDEIDYTLYEPAHPLGSAYYDYAIKNIPVMEASPDETQSMRYKLFTAPENLTNVPTIANLGNTSAASFTYSIVSIASSPATLQASWPISTVGASETYTIVLANSSLGFITVNDAAYTSTSTTNTQGTPQVIVTTNAAPNLTFKANSGIKIVGTYTTTITITGNDTGATVSIPVTLTVNA
jgi:hypothetical protein